MSALEEIGRIVGSRRYARDLVESSSTLLTRPWWDGVRNTWGSEEQNLLLRARTAHSHPSRGPANFKLNSTPHIPKEDTHD